ncbi:MAG: TRAP transporter substrate-binding protein DctP [Bacteriovoracaceae bacterium]|jgi:TRAP-type transport system periplasmic protein|nr:TRAP transporter substrate-binding protein DctP [Bacteriovoracaceae bacterium]
MKKFALVLFFISLNVLVGTDSAMAVRIKLGILAPEGTSWANNVKAMASEVKKETGGKVKFKVYYGGVQGDEPDVLRKIRIGQMHGGMFTGRTLGEISGDVRVMEIPFSFHHKRENAIKILNKMTPYFNTQFEKKGFKNLGFFEIGNVYIVTTKEVKNLKALKGLKIWNWEGDKVAQSMVESMKLVSVPLALPDVLSSLSTGIIDAAYSSPLGIIALQWQTKVKYVIDYPVTFSIGAFLIDMKQWKKLKPAYQKIITKVSNKYMEKASVDIVKENNEAMVSLKKLGIKFIEFSDEDKKDQTTIRADVVKRLRDKVISKKTFTKFNSHYKKL